MLIILIIIVVDNDDHCLTVALDWLLRASWVLLGFSSHFVMARDDFITCKKITLDLLERYKAALNL